MASDSWSEIRANGSVVRYRRWRPGTGSAVVVVGPARMGVIVPELPSPGTDIATWLGSFLEGLGTGGLTVLAAGPFYEAALAIAAHDPDRVTAVSPLAAG